MRRYASSALLVALALGWGIQGGSSLALGHAQGATKTFTETGKTVSGRFLQYWNDHGGLPQQGYPISEEMQEQSDINGQVYTVQYFERAVFELHPENQPPYDVLLSLLGTLALRAEYPGGRASGEVIPQGGNPQGARNTGQCTPTHDDSDAGLGAGFDPEAPQRETVGTGHVLTGTVLSSRSCLPIARARLEMRPEIGNEHPESQRATLFTGPDGRYRFESLPPEHIHMRVSAHGFKTIITNQYHPAPGESEGNYDIVLVPDPACREFEQTGQSVCGAFLDYWNDHGGIALQGYPLTDEFQEKSALNGKSYTVQYFERSVFESHPENQAPYNVLLSQLGTFRFRAKYGEPVFSVPTPTP